MKTTALEDLEAIETTVEQIEAILRGKGRAMQGAILGDLLATWLHGHTSTDGTKVSTAELRDEILSVHIEYVKVLVQARDIGD